MTWPMRLLCLLGLLVGLAGCVASPPIETLHGRTMGTTWSVKLVRPTGVARERVQRAIQGEVDRVVAQMSTWEPDSDLSRFNRAPAGTWQSLPDEFFGVLSHALALSEDSEGAFDPTVGPLVDLWGFGPGKPARRVPSDAELATTRARVGWQRVKLDPATKSAFQPGGAHVDLSAIAKGFGTDQIARALDRLGVRNYLVDISGELRARGGRPDGSDWQVAIEKPGAAPGGVDRLDEVERVIALRDRSIATSGDYRHFFADDGSVYSHHIDPRTGRPVPHRIASVTTVAADCMQADSTGTTIMVLGPEQGMAYATSRGLAVLLILHNGQAFEERMSPAFAALLRQ